MKAWVKNRKLIIYLLVSAFVVMSYGIGAEQHTFLSDAEQGAARLAGETFLIKSALETVQVEETSRTFAYVREYKQLGRQTNYGKASLFLLLFFAALFGITSFVQTFLDFYRRLFVRRRLISILYIHDSDGRKRSVPGILMEAIPYRIS